MIRLYEWSKRRWLPLLGGVAFTITCSALAWHAAAINPSFSSELLVALGSALIVVSAVSLGFIVRGRHPSRATRVPLILGPVVGCAAGGLGSIALVLWPDSWAALCLFAVAIIGFQVAGTLAIFVRVRGRPSQRPSQAS